MHAAPMGTGEQAHDVATAGTGETARGVGGGPQVPPQALSARIEFALPGALRTLPSNTTQAEAQLRGIGGCRRR